jgi:hypothetical protein
VITPPRTLIRREVVNGLIKEQAGEHPTPAGARAWPAHALPLDWEETYPLILVYDTRESVTGEVEGEDERTLEVELECYAAAENVETLEDLLDLLAFAAEQAVANNQALYQWAHSVKYQGTDKTRHHKGRTFYGLAAVRFQIAYIVRPLDEGSLDDFLRFHGEYDLAPPDQVVDATDDINLPAPEE